jgi:hypothetical protein
LRRKLSGWCTFLALSGIASSVSSLAISVAATSTTSTERLSLALTITAHHSAGRSVRSLLLDVRSRNNLGRKMKPFSQVVKTFGSEGVVIVLPWELGFDVTTGSEWLAGLDNVKILRVDVVVLWEVVVLLCDEDALTEEVLVDLLSVCLWDEPWKQ